MNRLRVPALLLISIGTIVFAIASFVLTPDIDEQTKAIANMSMRVYDAFDMEYLVDESWNRAHGTSSDIRILQLLGAEKEFIDNKVAVRRLQMENAVRALTEACDELLVIEKEAYESRLTTASDSELMTLLDELEKKREEGMTRINEEIANTIDHVSRAKSLRKWLVLVALLCQSNGFVMGIVAEWMDRKSALVTSQKIDDLAAKLDATGAAARGKPKEENHSENGKPIDGSYHFPDEPSSVS